MKKLLCIAGPTAVGKSAVALSLAKYYATDIISADSVQVYRELNIGSAKPSHEEQAVVKHHMIDIVAPDATFSAYEYAQTVQTLLASSTYENSVPLFVGGTAFYLDSLLYELDFEVNEYTMALREQYKQICIDYGEDYLHSLLEQKDAVSASRIHKHNVKRVIRALEISDSGGSISGERTRQARYPYTLIALTTDRRLLYERINRRVDVMIENGLIEEVQDLFVKYKNRQLQSLQSIGYKEIIEYLCGEVSLSNAIDNIKQHSRNYAKRQFSYLKRLNPIWIDIADCVCIEDKIIKAYEEDNQ